MPKNVVSLVARFSTVRKMLLQGAASTEIADKLKISTIVVNRITKEVFEDLKERMGQDFQLQVAQQLGRIELVERAAWEGWEASKLKESKEESTTDGEHAHSTTKQKTETSAGNPVFLKTILECVEKRSKLLGLDAIPDAGSVDDVPIVSVVVTSREDSLRIVEAQKFLKINTVDGAVVDKGE